MKKGLKLLDGPYRNRFIVYFLFYTYLDVKILSIVKSKQPTYSKNHKEKMSQKNLLTLKRTVIPYLNMEFVDISYYICIFKLQIAT